MATEDNGPNNIMLRYLRSIDAKLDRQAERIDTLTARINALEKQVALIVEMWAMTNGRIDHIETRLERIERRLNLVE